MGKGKVAIYARVSTSDGKQDYNRQIDDLTKVIKREGYSDNEIEIFAESISGYKKKDDRIEFKALLVNTSKTDPLSPAQCDPLKILFQNGVN